MNVTGRIAARRAARFAAALWLAAQAGLAQAQAAAGPAAPIPVEHFFERPAVLEAKLSPDGRRLALSTSYQAERVGLVVFELGQTLQARRVAQFESIDVARFEWAGAERLVFDVRDLQAGSAQDRHLAPGMYAVNADGSELRQLVQRINAPRVVTEAERRGSMLAWNHGLLHVPTPQEGVATDEVIVGRYEFSGRELVSVTPLWLNVRSGRQRSMQAGDVPEGAQGWWFDSQGRPRALRSIVQGRQSLWWRELKSGSWQRLAESDVLKPPFGLRSVGDDGSLYVTHAEGDEGLRVLSRFDFERLAPAEPPLVRTPGFDFSGTLLQERPGRPALGVRVTTDAEQTVWFDEGMKRMQALADERFPGRINRLSCRRCGEPDMVVLVQSWSDRDPGRLWLYEAGPQRWTAVTQALPQIDPQRMARVAFERIKARDGRDLPLWLTLPAGATKGQVMPTVVLVHGGPWVRGGHWRWSALEQFLASRGYLVISPEFRGSQGFGVAHYRAGWKQWGQAMQDDVADALLWARARGYADPQRACIAGGSYGGYAALMGLVRHPALYRCGAAWLAVADLPLLVQGSWWVDDDLSDEGRRYHLPELIGDAERDAGMLRAHSPVHQASRIRAPLLLAYGEADRRVPLAHGQRLREALSDAGRPPLWISYPGEGHGWARQATQLDFARQLEAFLARQLLGSDAPAAP